jgi:hypothetical protein
MLRINCLATLGFRLPASCRMATWRSSSLYLESCGGASCCIESRCLSLLDFTFCVDVGFQRHVAGCYPFAHLPFIRNFVSASALQAVRRPCRSAIVSYDVQMLLFAWFIILCQHWDGWSQYARHRPEFQIVLSKAPVAKQTLLVPVSLAPLAPFDSSAVRILMYAIFYWGELENGKR